MSLHIQTLSGAAMLPYLHELARLRIEVFREFPYCYQGSMAYEQAYLTTFAEATDSVLVIALDGQQVVGASTGLPMVHEPEEVQRPWQDRGFDCSKIFYFSESVLSEKHRGRGIGVRFFEEREKWARTLEKFHLLCFCAVIRPDNHPLKPEAYQPLDRFWQKRGFGLAKGYTCQMQWADLNQTAQTEKTLQYWAKLI